MVLKELAGGLKKVGSGVSFAKIAFQTLGVTFVTVTDLTLALKLCEEHGKAHELTGSDKKQHQVTITIEDGTVLVKLFDLSADVSNANVAKFLERYGDVRDVYEEQLGGVQEFAGAYTGIRVAKMVVRENIASWITINGEDTKCVYYTQKATCKHCHDYLHIGVVKPQQPAMPQLNPQQPLNSEQPLNPQQPLNPKNPKPKPNGGKLKPSGEHVEKSLDGRLIALRVQNTTLCNVYAPSGTALRAERERFFNGTLAYHLRHNTDHIVLAGDFNCVLRPCDSTSSNPSVVHNAESRLDRVYVSAGLCDQLRAAATHDQFHIRMRLYPYYVIRVNKMSCAGADRLQTGMPADHVGALERSFSTAGRRGLASCQVQVPQPSEDLHLEEVGLHQVRPRPTPGVLRRVYIVSDGCGVKFFNDHGPLKNREAYERARLA
ncbi:hypothetical protein quinque_002307 [Culex quinquefasciatus]